MWTFVGVDSTPRPSQRRSLTKGASDCLNHPDQEERLLYDHFDVDEYGRGPPTDAREAVNDHPFLALQKLLSDGSFYYSLDFNLTDRLQDR